MIGVLLTVPLKENAFSLNILHYGPLLDSSGISTAGIPENAMDYQLFTFVRRRLRGTDLNWSDHEQVLGPVGRVAADIEQGVKPDKSRELLHAYKVEVASDLPTVSTQLQSERRDFWDSYDRLRAEARLRLNTAIPLIALVVIATWPSAKEWWLLSS